ncbi:MAG: PilX N-terminal domain-containing pilus assembly protein [Guyparkeria sp.]|uniref:pilus assembly PilX family protein n=1 Tax=Guyparkeria sp. TaxID=2035736 RepID=UPI00397DA658
MTRHHNPPHAPIRSQRGMATVLVSIILLIAATLIAFFTARSAVVEQQITANEMRSKQALAAAEAGIQDALWTMQESGISSSPITPATNNHGGFGGAGQPTYQVAFCDPADPGIDEDSCPRSPGAPTCNPAPGGIQQAIAASCGWSDDRSARHLVTRMLRNTPSLPGTPTNPVTAKGGVNVTGNVSVANYFNNLTVWTGEKLDNTSATGKTFIRKPTLDVPENPDFTDPDSWADYTPPEGETDENFNFANCTNSANFICGTQKDVQGPDVIDQDTTLAGISDDDLFLNYFGNTPDAYRDTVVTEDVAAGDLGDDLNGEVIWVDGDLNDLPDLGTRTEPVILIVDGDVTVDSNSELNGVLYVRGDIEGAGTPRINGALVAEGSVNKSGGNIEVLYDPLAVGLSSRLGSAASVPGTWRDW